MRIIQVSRASQAGFTLIEVIISIVLGSIIGVIFLSYMGTQLTNSSDPVNITRYEGDAEMWMERILSDYVEEMNAATYTATLPTIFARDYTTGIYNMPASVTLTRTYVTYDAGGNEVAVTGGGTSTNLKVTVQAGGYGLTCILTAERVTSGDPVTYY
ncbi:MAG: prepilin-type N-terminal cleavage/methylation domain-containing protein [Proteobacteria bacterium]|nr:prepilin-type N-terminal cleavage/methylation domain-containing protein [Pseudomonadota bacterium]